MALRHGLTFCSWCLLFSHLLLTVVDLKASCHFSHKLIIILFRWAWTSSSWAGCCGTRAPAVLTATCSCLRARRGRSRPRAPAPAPASSAATSATARGREQCDNLQYIHSFRPKGGYPRPGPVPSPAFLMPIVWRVHLIKFRHSSCVCSWSEHSIFQELHNTAL